MTPTIRLFHFGTLFCLTVTLLLARATAQDATSQPATSQPSDSSASNIIDVADKAAIDANMDKDVTVEGVVDTAEWSSSGRVLRVQFKGNQQTKFQAVVFDRRRKDLDAAFSGDVAKTLAGARVRIHGKLKLYKERPEITIDSPTQVTVLEPGASTPSSKPAGS